ncbi:U11/U12 small nuclear ribonucleoprotein 65 kDa protein-like isoform X1 [Zingiber officinale]|uniref:U11/U12 small nuclear ribonucleoprotein 65 kDa protein-like isoform X1 n=1 Tax=Zingiber officinale TaxID=94328 RepID=UPI001C4D96DD|nr:U11/U12 small nuclear ribonucleoprotein 65 kDa protein-like isoform X1 [Zingiber officinale]XP_042381460.1 U11/U12 small nuclear ribonucleoprotein 65 kDa protein-like isoform X1 [Zingiber officinale]XP_042381461.1 U11/U12 small nuclear ribonucleoprotein 65 kDa protein-like isoform X1 [Zingiber officinale]XP_042381462.1 U11/U12 small nuclear ribonucleoprotein 65 kDa protein-like isoform X1 [Zingiber officinale]
MSIFFPPAPMPTIPETAPPPPPSNLVPESEESSSGAEAAATLLVRHLPEGMPHDLLSRLFSHYGASSVRPCAGGRLRNCAFVDFKDEVLATQAQTQLNRLRFLGKVLKVERASKPNLKSADQKSDSQSKKDSTANSSHLKESFTNQKNLTTGEPIAPRLGVDYPFPPHLEYAYPPPDGNILTNIVNALIAVPRFYTQVLHLMNKMNIPAPFRMALPTPPLPPPIPAAPPPSPPRPPTTTAMKSNLNDLSSEESEMESSEEDAESSHRQKRRRQEAIVGPAVDRGVAHEDVGLKPVSLVPKEIPVIRKKNPVLQIKVAPKPVLKETMEKDMCVKEPALDNEHFEHSLIATPQEIESGKLPPEEILSLPMFKNYSPGDPASVLYIKNLAKDVVVDDFYFIFGSLFGSIEAARVGLTIKLMQEGRMRGQAFVTFPSVDLAQHALNLVNGYVFKGKPIIIQFGRNSGAAKAN